MGLKSSSSSLESSPSEYFFFEARALALGVLAEKLVVSFTSSLGSADLNYLGVIFLPLEEAMALSLPVIGVAIIVAGVTSSSSSMRADLLALFLGFRSSSLSS